MKVLEELTGCRTLISDIGEHRCYAGFKLAQIYLEIPVPLLPLWPLCFGSEFLQTLHNCHTKGVYVNPWRLLTLLPNLRSHVPVCSDDSPRRVGRLYNAKVCQEEVIALVKDVRWFDISMNNAARVYVVQGE